MKCTNLSNLCIIACAMLSCSAPGANKITRVTSESYGSRACWFDPKGNLAAFLVLAKQDGLAVPYLISANCLVKGDYTSEGEAILHHLNTVRLADLDGKLQRAVPDAKVVGNIGSELPQPASASHLYYFEASVERLNNPNIKIYSPTKIGILTDLNVSFDTFLGWSIDKREEIMQTYRPKGDV